MATIVMLQNVDGDNSPASEPVELGPDDTFGVEGISGDTVLVEYRLHPDHAWATLYTFTADGVQVNVQSIEARFRVSVYSAGDINAYVCK